MLEARFGNWTAPAAPKGTKNFAATPPAPKPRIVLVNRPQSPQSLILAGAVLPVRGTDDVLTLNAANEVLGGNFLSRINMDLRETKGWSYGAGGNFGLNVQAVPYQLNAPVQADRTGDSIKAINEQFGGYDAFREQFKTAATGQFGSGWTWLTYDGGQLAVSATGNADLPMKHGQTAVLTCDVWEHAYYIDYRNARPNYVDAMQVTEGSALEVADWAGGLVTAGTETEIDAARAAVLKTGTARTRSVDSRNSTRIPGAKR